MCLIRVDFRLTRSEVKSAGKLIYKKGSVAADGPDPHKISRKLSDPDIHHVSEDSPTNTNMSSSIHSVSLSIPIGSPSMSSVKHSKYARFSCMLNSAHVTPLYIF